MTIYEAHNMLCDKLNYTESVEILKFVTGTDVSNPFCDKKELINIEEQKKIADILKMRQNNYPLQYIIGKWYFMDREFYVGRGVLIPRDDTEVLVRRAFSYLDVLQKSDKNIENPKVLDLCSGSGIIAISIKKQFPLAEVISFELSDVALKYITKNAQLNNADIDIIKGDIFTDCHKFDDNYFDAIISNPPYIDDNDMKTLQPEVNYEPSMALSGGKDGLDFYRSIINNFTPKLKKGGLLAFELGENQFDSVRAMMEKNFANISGDFDLGGIYRAINGTLK